MKVAKYDKFGPPETLYITEVPKPSIKDNEILVRVFATSATAGDARIRAARFPRGFGFFAKLFFGFRKPRIKILGSTYSGIIESVGNKVTDFKIGDEVCGMTGMKMGTYAEFIKVNPRNSTVIKPKVVSHQQAAGLLFGGTAALYFVRDKSQIAKGEKVAINGASGAVGTNAVQLAKYFGAEVTGVTSSTNAKLVTNLGADKILDYTKTPLIECGEKFDVVVDTVGNVSSKDAVKLLNDNGRLALMVASLSEMVKAKGNIRTGTATENKDDIQFLLSLLEQGKLKVVIDKVYSLNQIVDAHKRIDSGNKVGNIVIEI